MRQPAPGLVPQSGELGACSPPLARLPHSPVPSRPWRRGQPCSSRPCPGREPGPAPLAWLLGLVLLAHSSGTPWTSVPHPLWSPRLTCQLTPEASPALVRSFHDCLQTPPASVFRPPSCPSPACSPAASPACPVPSTLLVPVPCLSSGGTNVTCFDASHPG